MRDLRIVPILLCIGLWTTSLQAYSGGAGTADDPYQIATPEDLIALGQTPADYNKHFLLTADIDLAGHAFKQAVIAPYVNKGARRPGHKHVLFAGSFDGKGHVIRNLQIEGTGHLGLFGDVAPSGMICNLGIEAASVRGGLPVGALVGVNAGRVSNCHSRAEIAGQAGRAGGLIGTNTGTVVGCHSDGHTTVQVRGVFCWLGGLIGENSGSVSDCYSTGRIGDEGARAAADLGGLIGRNGGNVSQCYSAAEVSGARACIGGLIGTNSGAILDCYTTGRVSGKQACIGGLVGRNDRRVSRCYSTADATSQESRCAGGLAGENRGHLFDCYSVGKVVGSTRVGGLVGSNSDTGSTRNCCSTGPVTGDAYVGGLVGFNGGAIVNTFSTGAVAGNSNTGGLIGRNSLGIVVHSYWDTETSGVSTSSKGQGLTTAEMQNVDLYLNADWDFLGERVNGLAESWQMPESGGYPQLTAFGDYRPVEPQGRGTGAEPYLIETAEELASVAYRPLAHYRLAADIDLAGITWLDAAIPWFGGRFDGAGHVIRHLHVSGATALGLFGILGADAIVTGVVLQEGVVDAVSGYAGLLAGCSGARVTMCRCDGTVTGVARTHDWGVGGLMGYSVGHVSGCYFSGEVNVRGRARGGGLIGVTSGEVSGCHCEVKFTGSGGYFGGLIGANHGRVSQCYSQGEMNMKEASMVGGLVGWNLRGQVSACHSKTTISAKKVANLGGLVGANWEAAVSSCYSSGSVAEIEEAERPHRQRTSRRTAYGDRMSRGPAIPRQYGGMGGLVGSNDKKGVVRNCYSCAAVEGHNSVGGLIGRNLHRVDRSFWDVDSSGEPCSCGGAGLTTAEAMDAKWVALQGWADDPNWVLDTGRDYPRLVWEGKPGDRVPESVLDWITGRGTLKSPYEIHDPKQLLRIGKASMLWEMSYILTSDLDLSPISWPQAVLPDFGGTFYGDGHVIQGLKIDGGDDLGFFGRLSPTSEVHDLELSEVRVTGSGACIGALAGICSGRVSNCRSTGQIKGTYEVGGLVGSGRGGSILNCHTIGLVTGDYSVGGLIGGTERYSGTLVSDCTSAASIQGKYNAGGLVGTHTAKSISRCCSTGAVKAEENAGGLVGTNGEGSISQCYSTGRVTGDLNVGGLVGYNGRTAGSSVVADSYSTGLVVGRECVGGLIGNGGSTRGSCTVVRCYSIGPVIGSSNVGGLLGREHSMRRVVNCFWDTGTSGQESREKERAMGLTMVHMQDRNTYLDAEWDFVDETENGTDDVWWIDDGSDYPHLAWERAGGN